MSKPRKLAPKAPAESQRATAARLSDQLGFTVTREMVRHWTKKGYSLHDVEALRRSLRNQVRCPLPKEPRQPVLVPPPGEPTEPPTPEEIDARIAALEQSLLHAPDYAAARTIKTQIEGMRVLLKVQQERGVLMPVADAETAGRIAGQASRQAWEKLEDELPPMLEGLTAAQMKAKLREFARARCMELSNLFRAG